MSSADDGTQPSTSAAAEDMSPEPEQPREPTSDITDREQMKDSTVDAAAGTSDSAEQASGGAAMDTESTAGAAAATSSSKDQPTELPFQVQITYTDLDGAEAIRVLTQTQPVTRDRHQAENSKCYLLFDHPRSSVVYNFGRVCMSVCMRL